MLLADFMAHMRHFVDDHGLGASMVKNHGPLILALTSQSPVMGRITYAAECAAAARYGYRLLDDARCAAKPTGDIFFYYGAGEDYLEKRRFRQIMRLPPIESDESNEQHADMLMRVMLDGLQTGLQAENGALRLAPLHMKGSCRILPLPRQIA